MTPSSVKVLRQPNVAPTVPASRKAQADAERNAHEEHAHRTAAPVLAEQFGQQRDGRRHQRRFAGGDEEARCDHLLEVLRGAGGRGTDAPDQNPCGDHLRAAEAVGERAHEHGHDAEAQHPHRAGEEAVLRIGDAEFAGDLRREAEQHVAIDVRDHVDYEQESEHGSWTVFPSHGLSPRLGNAIDQAARRSGVPRSPGLRLGA